MCFFYSEVFLGRNAVLQAKSRSRVHDETLHDLLRVPRTKAQVKLKFSQELQCILTAQGVKEQVAMGCILRTHMSEVQLKSSHV
jgi:hypothetical protein